MNLGNYRTAIKKDYADSPGNQAMRAYGLWVPPPLDALGMAYPLRVECSPMVGYPTQSPGTAAPMMAQSSPTGGTSYGLRAQGGSTDGTSYGVRSQPGVEQGVASRLGKPSAGVQRLSGYGPDSWVRTFPGAGTPESLPGYVAPTSTGITPVVAVGLSLVAGAIFMATVMQKSR